MEDGKKSDGCIAKVLHQDITLNNVDRTIGLHDETC